MAAPEILLTEEQRLEFTQIPQNISEWEIVGHYTFTDDDIEIINRHRRDHNRMGFAVQLCCLRHMGRSLGIINDIPETVLDYIGEQLHINPMEFKQYANRENTRLEHLQELREEYGYKNFTDSDSIYLSEFLMPSAMENDNAGRLIRLAIDEMKAKKVILPGITTIEKLVKNILKKAEDTVMGLVKESLTYSQKCQLDKLIESPDEMVKTTLAYLKEVPGQSSPKAFLEVIEKLEIIRSLDLNLNIDVRLCDM